MSELKKSSIKRSKKDSCGKKNVDKHLSSSTKNQKSSDCTKKNVNINLHKNRYKTINAK